MNDDYPFLDEFLSSLAAAAEQDDDSDGFEEELPSDPVHITAGRIAALQAAAGARGNDLTDTERRVREHLGLRSLSEILTCTPPPVMVEGLLPKIGVCLLYGDSGTAKTYSAVYLAWAVAGGTDTFLGQKIHNHGDVLYISAEDDTGVASRYRALTLAYGVPHHDVYITNKLSPLDGEAPAFHAADGTPSTLTALTPHVLLASLQAAGVSPALVVVDTFSTAFSSLESENDNTQVASLIRQMETVSTELECPVLVLHHTGKDDGKGARGASSFKGNAFSIMKSAKDKNGVFTISSEKWKAGQPFEEPLRVYLTTTHDETLPESAPQVSVLDHAKVAYRLAAPPVYTSDEVDADGTPLHFYEALDGARAKLGKGDYSASEIKKKAGRPGASGALTTEILQRWAQLRGIEEVSLGAKVRYVL